ncbi:MAG: DUF896 domain-containing protein [Clostridiales bacterium]|nr:DUF896 domain-containing protein [Candidatus Crickella caballi]
MDQVKIDRINELAHKSKSEGLTVEEKIEQSELRKEFLAAIRADLKATLDTIEIVDDDDELKS